VRYQCLRVVEMLQDSVLQEAFMVNQSLLPFFGYIIYHSRMKRIDICVEIEDEKLQHQISKIMKMLVT